MKKIFSTALILLLPTAAAFAQNSVAEEIGEMQGVLNGIYGDMIGLSSGFMSVARAIGGVGAMLYVAIHVWVKIARAEHIDFLPLFRPLAFGFAIMLYPQVLAAINGILHSTVSISESITDNKHKAVERLLEETEKKMKAPGGLYDMYVGPDGSGDFDKYLEKNELTEDTGWTELDEWVQFKSEATYYKIRNTMRFLLFHFFAILFQAAAFIINVLRTFILIILAIIGPFVLGISIWPGLGDSFINWLVRYIHVYFWLPVANIFGAIIAQIQENMLTEALLSTEELVGFSANDAMYIIFMITGIIGYMAVPSVASYIANPGHMGNILRASTNAFNKVVNYSKGQVQQAGSAAYSTLKGEVGGTAWAAREYAQQSKASDYIKNKLN